MVQPATKGSNDLLEVVGFVLEKGKRIGEGGDDPRLVTEEETKAKGRTLVCS
jgi:hypothetical protein